MLNVAAVFFMEFRFGARHGQGADVYRGMRRGMLLVATECSE